jgi:hypothetical protein
MTAAQTAMYFAEFGKLRDVLRARGWSSTKCEQHRHALTRKALGADKSSKHFTNRELDAVLAAIRAELQPANFDAQMQLQDMPAKRRSILIHRIDELCRHLHLTEGSERAYVDGISRRMFGDQYHDLPERPLQQLEGILRKRLRALHVVERVHQIEREAAAYAERMVAIVAPEIERQAAAKSAAAAITEEEFDPAEPFG